MRWIQTNKFTDNYISVKMFLPFTREVITPLNLALLMMKTKTEMYPSRSQLSLLLNEAYNFKVSLHLTGLSSHLMVEYRFHYLQSSYCPQPLSEHKIVTILDQFLFHPLVDEAVFEEAMVLYRNRLQRLKDDPEYQASQACLQLLDPGHTASISIQGYEADLDRCTFSSLKTLIYSLQALPKTIYACGMLEPKVDQYLKKISTPTLPALKSNLYTVSSFQEICIPRQVSQSSLCMAYRTGIGVCDSLWYALVLFTSVLGQCPNNLLFETIREKHSLCYEIHTSLIRFDGLLLIQTGLRKEHYTRVRALIDQQIDRISHQDYADSVLEHAKKDWIDAMKGVQDTPFAWMDQVFYEDLLKRGQSKEQQILQISQIQKTDLVLVAQRLKQCAVAFVEGLDEEF